MHSYTDSIKIAGIEILSDLGKFPATSYWEDGPSGYLINRAKRVGLEVSVDQWGNVLAVKPGSDPNAWI